MTITAAENALYQRQIRARRLAEVIARLELEIGERQRAGRGTRDAEQLLEEYRATLATLEARP